jgi:uncharacterized protein YodC (DUF2158 family)
MSKLNIADFEIGDQVVHVTNRSTVMAVIQIDSTRNEVKCRWVDKKATSQTENFLPQELEKYKHDPTGGLYLG